MSGGGNGTRGRRRRQRAPRRGLRALLLLTAAAVAAGLVVAGFAAITAMVGEDRPEWEVGACLGPTAAGEYYALSCTSTEAVARIIRVVPGATYAREADCPEATDVAVNVRAARTVCARNLRPPHPGDPGEGGGVLRAGDCIGRPSEAPAREMSCAGSDWYGRVIARVADAGACPPRTTLEAATVQGSPRTVLCLGEGGEVLGPGDCIEEYDPAADGSTPAKVGCGDGRAWGRILARTDRRADCPARADRYLEARGAFRPVVCLRSPP